MKTDYIGQVVLLASKISNSIWRSQIPERSGNPPIVIGERNDQYLYWEASEVAGEDWLLGQYIPICDVRYLVTGIYE